MQDAINNLKTSNSSGPDETTLSCVKISAPILIPELNRIFNLSLSSSIYPHKSKVAKVIPIHKNCDHTYVNNYRPISILNTINKLFEKILHKRLTKYIEGIDLIYKYQFEFRKNHSTELALIEMVDQIKMSLDDGKITCGIFVDLSKAFDTVNREFHIGKLEHCVITGRVLELFKNYLENCEQCVYLDNHKFDIRTIN